MTKIINVKELEKRIQDVQLTQTETSPKALADALSWEQQNWLTMIHQSMDLVGEQVSDWTSPLSRDPNRPSKMDRLGHRVSGIMGE